MAPRSPDDRDDRDREDLPALLDDLDRTLSELRTELERRDESASRSDVDRRGEGRRRRDRTPFRPPGSPRPPSVSELFRFTEQYTIPTVVATLEAAIQSLELLRGMLRLADPDRSAFDRDGRGARDASTAARLGSGVSGFGRGAVSGVERALSELQTALSETELPEDETSRELLEDARRLSEEVSGRLSETAEGRERGGGRRGERESRDARASEGSSPRSGAVEIDVTGAGEDSGADGATDDTETSDAEPPEVDVEAELASIKDEVERRSADQSAADGDGTDDESADDDGDGENTDESGGSGTS
ncbi:DUF7547 family protein [Halobellus sp. EA9]|uniref:DUF7547 family protein n=1 Tax=Halobellus sp. EA9 TaxID=3421647 RepID=UPI003EBBA981